MARGELCDDARLGERFREAIAAGLLRDTGAVRLAFWAAAEQALAVGKDPAALFVWIVRGQHWGHIGAASEDAALDRLRGLDRARRATSLPPDVADLLGGIGKMPE